MCSKKERSFYLLNLPSPERGFFLDFDSIWGGGMQLWLGYNVGGVFMGAHGKIFVHTWVYCVWVKIK